MMFCRECGQCSHLGDENFYEILNTQGWEKSVIDCVTGENIDYIDSQITDSDHCNYECPNCGSEDVENDWDGGVAEAEEHRDEHNVNLSRLRRSNDERTKQAEEKRKSKDPNREWDVMENV